MDTPQSPINVVLKMADEDNRTNAFDIWRVIADKWKLLALITLAFLLAGLSLALFLLKSTKEQFYASILLNYDTLDIMTWPSGSTVTADNFINKIYIEEARKLSGWYNVDSEELLTWIGVIPAGNSRRAYNVTLTPTVTTSKEQLASFLSCLNDVYRNYFVSLNESSISSSNKNIEMAILDLKKSIKINDYPISVRSIYNTSTQLKNYVNSWVELQGALNDVNNFITKVDAAALEIEENKLTKDKITLLKKLDSDLAETQRSYKLAVQKAAQLTELLGAMHVSVDNSTYNSAVKATNTVIELSERIDFYEHLIIVYMNAPEGANGNIDLSRLVDELDILYHTIIKDKDLATQQAFNGQPEITSQFVNNYNRTKFILTVGGMTALGLVISLLITFFNASAKLKHDNK